MAPEEPHRGQPSGVPVDLKPGVAEIFKGTTGISLKDKILYFSYGVVFTLVFMAVPSLFWSPEQRASKETGDLGSGAWIIDPHSKAISPITRGWSIEEWLNEEFSEGLEDDKSLPEILQRYLEVMREIIDPKDPMLAQSLSETAYAYLSRALKAQEDYKRAQEYLEEALSIYEQTPTQNLHELENTLRMLAIVHQGQGDKSKSEAYLARASEIKAKLDR